MQPFRPPHSEDCPICRDEMFAKLPQPDYAAIWRGIRVGLAMVAPFWLLAFLALVLCVSGGGP